MTDITALKILSSHIESFQKLPDPPDTLSDDAFDNYKAGLEQSLDKAVKSVQDVSAYAENITKKLDELKKCLPEQVKRIQDAIKALIGRLVVAQPGGTLSNKHLKIKGTRRSENLKLIGALSNESLEVEGALPNENLE
ncbi:hypothetical protein MAR_013670, partial [Mya arenaria]